MLKKEEGFQVKYQSYSRLKEMKNKIGYYSFILLIFLFLKIWYILQGWKKAWKYDLNTNQLNKIQQKVLLLTDLIQAVFLTGRQQNDQVLKDLHYLYFYFLQLYFWMNWGYARIPDLIEASYRPEFSVCSRECMALS